MMSTIEEGPYEKLRIDGRWKDESPLNKLESEDLNLLKDLKNNHGLKISTHKSLIVSNPKMPVMYGLPKIHKVGDKMRPIISSIKTLTSKIAKYVVKSFKEMKSRN